MTTTKTATVVYKPPPPHICMPPNGARQSLPKGYWTDFGDHPVGAIAECECGTMFARQVYAGGQYRGMPVWKQLSNEEWGALRATLNPIDMEQSRMALQVDRKPPDDDEGSWVFAFAGFVFSMVFLMIVAVGLWHTAGSLFGWTTLW